MGMNDATNEYIALKCLDCNKVNIYPAWAADGQVCKECGGRLIPIGYVAVKKD